MKSILIKISLIMVSVFIALLCIEFALSFTDIPAESETWQVSGPFQLDEELIYSLKPLQDTITGSSGFSEHIQTNSYGLRDAEILKDKSYEKRILILGDSMTFGHGVSSEQSYPNQLEKIYREKGRDIDVINAGIKGYGTDQSYKLFVKRLQPLKPDLVVFAVFMNDIYDNIILPLYSIDNDGLVPLNPKKNWLYISGSINNMLPEFIMKRNIPRFIFSRTAEKDWFSVLPDLDEKGLIIWSIKKTYYQIEKLQELGKANGFKLLVLCMPHKGNIPNAYSWLEKDDIWLFNAHKDSIWNEQEDDLFFGNDYHLTKKGNALLAQNLYAFLRRSDF